MDKKSLMILCDIEAGRQITLYPEAGEVGECNYGNKYYSIIYV